MLYSSSTAAVSSDVVQQQCTVPDMRLLTPNVVVVELWTNGTLEEHLPATSVIIDSETTIVL